MTTTPVPSTPPTSADITALAGHIAADGTRAHHHALCQVADAVETAGVLPGAVSVLRDSHATETTQARAFLAVVRRWDDIVAAHRAAFDRGFAALATHWEAHQRLRSQGNIEQLARSGRRLDELRAQMRVSVCAQ